MTGVGGRPASRFSAAAPRRELPAVSHGFFRGGNFCRASAAAFDGAVLCRRSAQLIPIRPPPRAPVREAGRRQHRQQSGLFVLAAGVRHAQPLPERRPFSLDPQRRLQ